MKIKLRYIFIPLLSILYLVWSDYAITNLSLSMVVSTNYLVIAWLAFNSSIILSILAFFVVKSFTFIMKNW